MKLQKLVVLIGLSLILIASCSKGEKVGIYFGGKIIGEENAPIADDINRGPYNQDLQSIITLSYTDAENDLATSCAVLVLSNVTVTQPCACDLAGVCTVGVTGTPGYYGAASFDYTVTTNNIVSNTATSSISVICPSSYIGVAGSNSLDLLTNDFCVMEYEAKFVAGPVATSKADDTPWVSIGIGDAYDECNYLNPLYNPASDTDSTGFDLLSNPEWMTMARNIEAQASNWFGGVNMGCVFQGNTNGNINCSYVLTPNGVDFGAGRDTKARLTLSNGQQIWDLAGNVWEWVDWSVDPGLQPGPTACDSGVGFIEVKDASCINLSSGDYLPLNPLLTSANGMGRFYADNSSPQSYAVRGGRYSPAINAGIYSLYMDEPLNNPGPETGFRCVYRPTP